MKRRPTVSRAVWLLFAGSLALLGGLLAVRHFWPVRGDGSRELLASLHAERAALPAIDPRELAQWRERQAALAAERWTEAALSALQRRIGARWRWTETGMNGDFRGFQLAAASPAELLWDEILATVAGLEATPGLNVEGVAIATAGTRSLRNFSAVEIQVTLRWAGPGHTVAPVSPNPDRRDRVRPKAGGKPEAAAGRRVRPAARRFAVHSAARAVRAGGSISGCAGLRDRPRPPAARPGGGSNQRRA